MNREIVTKYNISTKERKNYVLIFKTLNCHLLFEIMHLYG